MLISEKEMPYLTNKEFVFQLRNIDKKIRENMSWTQYKGGDQLKQLPSNEALAKEGRLIINQSLCAYVRWALPYLPEEGVEAVANFLTGDQLLASYWNLGLDYDGAVVSFFLFHHGFKKIEFASMLCLLFNS